jgi:hypothetical protein
VEEALGQVNTTTRPFVVVEGAAHLGLVAGADQGETIMLEYGAEIGAGFEVIKVDTMFFGHAVPTR